MITWSLWNSEKDVLQIKVLQKAFQATKPAILSYVSSIFDPLVLLVPVLLKPRHLKLDLDTLTLNKLENL